MKAINLIAASLLFGTAGVALATGPTVTYPDEAPIVSTKTRDEVKADLAEARRLGLIVYGERDTPSAVSEQEPKTRAQVQAELAQARKFGLVVYGERDVPIATREQERQIELAGLRAVQRAQAANK